MKKVLVVEDSNSYSELLKTSIEKSGEFSATVCTTRAETLAVLSEDNQFIAAVLDLNLPDAHYGEIVDDILKMQIPPIILTGSMSQDLRQNIIARPIVDYVFKQNWSDIHYVVTLIERLNKNPKIKILVVDDEKSFRHYVADLLRIHGFQVLTAGDGKTALAILEQHQDEIYLVITDYHMPEMDGLELTQNIRKHHNRAEVCIITITADHAPYLSAQFLKAGANDLIRKPFLVEEFYSRINHHVEVIEKIELIKDMALKDQLTGLYNRRFLFEHGNQRYLEAQHKGDPVTIAIIDVDYFKAVNDRFGHDVGDFALKRIAEQFNRSAKSKDIVTRFGGEEFCLIIFNHENPYVFFEMLRRDIENLRLKTEDSELLHLTISIGYIQTHDIVMGEAIRLADLALYQAKEMGRNRVIESDDSNATSNSDTISPRIRMSQRPIKS